MPEAFVDRRVQKTLRLLKEALITLISEKGYDAVTVQDILDRANVGRSTFYIHFENKQALLHSCFDDLNQLFEQHNINISSGEKSADFFIKSDFTLNLFRFIKLNHRLIKAILQEDVMSIFNSPIQDYIFTHISETLKALTQNKKQAPLPLEVLAHYLTSAFIGTLKWWVDKDIPCTAEELDKIFKRLAFYDIQHLLG
jgi:AcrR family transcriptional regulator